MSVVGPSVGSMEDEVERESGRPSGRFLVDALRAEAAREHAAQVRQVELIARLCAAYATLEASGPALPGHERLVPAGGDGTPRVAEHLATELAPALRITITAACLRIADSVDLVHRHPLLWAAARAGRVRVWQAAHVASATRAAGLSREAALWVDERLAPTLAHLPWGRAKHKLAGLIVRADTALATRRAAEAQAARFVRIRQNGDGTALVVARTDAADAFRLDHALTQLAGQLTLAGHTDALDVLRAAALGVLARPEHGTALLAGPDGPRRHWLGPTPAPTADCGGGPACHPPRARLAGGPLRATRPRAGAPGEPVAGPRPRRGPARHRSLGQPGRRQLRGAHPDRAARALASPP